MSARSSKHPRGRLRQLALVGVGLFFFLGIVGPWIAPFDPRQIDLRHAFEGASARHWLGTGDNGIDLLSALLFGARLALIVGASVVAITATLGTALGVLAASFGGWVDDLIGAWMDLLQSFPGIILNVALLAMIAEASVGHVIAALCIPGWVLYARIARAQALSLQQAAFVEAAITLGQSRLKILGKHIVPNLMAPILVQASAAFGGVILVEATLSFLGLGPSGAVSWGMLLDQGTGALMVAPQTAMVAGAAIAITVLSFNLVGDRAAGR